MHQLASQRLALHLLLAVVIAAVAGIGCRCEKATEAAPAAAPAATSAAAPAVVAATAPPDKKDDKPPGPRIRQAVIPEEPMAPLKRWLGTWSFKEEVLVTDEDEGGDPEEAGDGGGALSGTQSCRLAMGGGAVACDITIRGASDDGAPIHEHAVATWNAGDERYEVRTFSGTAEAVTVTHMTWDEATETFTGELTEVNGRDENLQNALTTTFRFVGDEGTVSDLDQGPDGEPRVRGRVVYEKTAE